MPTDNISLEDLVAPLWQKVGGELTVQTIPLLRSDETTLLAYAILRQELLEGGFVQLIQNGYGPFIFLNPFAKALRLLAGGSMMPARSMSIQGSNWSSPLKPTKTSWLSMSSTLSGMTLTTTSWRQNP